MLNEKRMSECYAYLIFGGQGVAIFIYFRCIRTFQTYSDIKNNKCNEISSDANENIVFLICRSKNTILTLHSTIFEDKFFFIYSIKLIRLDVLL